MSTESNPDIIQHNTGELRELLRATMPGNIQAIAGVIDAVTQVLTRLEVPEQKRFEIELAVREALANAVMHGCDNDPSKEVHCQCSCDTNGRILIVVTDPGPGFKTEASAVQLYPNLYAEHGRGVYLMRQLMDDVRFEGRGNEVRMWKY
jgi:anti-sigma regulatory factor (Ser/Thr protein kinase)